ncbi:DUF3612 domain-containing protein [Vibrio aphrogenes]|uniref:DUF3612 domain-containing protein n=1 Tax=Vibrio aphrogenes TaxID=1891186 RepID=UPI000B34F291|nr:DUF3612 domain-containing protein [Vibrio aphrogenes]
MKTTNTLNRQSHFLGTKVRNLRKRNGLTLEDLSSRCIKIDPEDAPSVSYLSMIERGKRVPSEGMLEVIAQVFQKPLHWFLDDASEEQEITPEKGSRGGINGMALEPSFLFSNDILQIAIPEMLSQTGTTGHQFAHLLIRAHQEHHQNHFPDLEKAAEQVGQKRMPLAVEDLLDICKDVGVTVKWFDEPSQDVVDSHGVKSKHIVRSYAEAPGVIRINRALKASPEKLKYDLAVHIGHKVLHNSDGEKHVIASDNRNLSTLKPDLTRDVNRLDSTHILQAWRDFECSFFAGALLCPRVPFRQLLDRHGYEISVSQLIGVSESVVMRRMTAVSPYPYWHYFDAYNPGKLKAVYRGNGIPLPWGNMRMVEDPCQHWSVFRMIGIPGNTPVAQISVLNQDGVPHIYCCESVKVKDMAGNYHVLCSGVDLNPALEAQGQDAVEIAKALQKECVRKGGQCVIPYEIKKSLLTVARILNINWIERGIDSEARVICARGGMCPRQPRCYKEKSPTVNVE